MNSLDYKLDLSTFSFLLFRRYNDKSSTSLDLENFLVDAYAKQIKELNSSTGKNVISLFSCT